MWKLLTILLFVSLPFLASGQVENNTGWITYDSAIQTTADGLHFHQYTFRITRPPYGDTTKRISIWMMPGEGENGGTNTAKLIVYGMHYWLNNGWDGSVTLLSGGKRYPILITCISDQTAPYAEDNLLFMDYMVAHYPIRAGAIHITGLSAGSWAWTTMINYQRSSGSEEGMKRITSVLALSGFATNALYIGDQTPPYQIGLTAWGHWAKKYNGKYFGLQGSSDGVSGIYLGQQRMDDSVAGHGYFSYENIGGGAHCCWNSMYDPSAKHWNSTGTKGPNNVTGAQPNAQGTYIDGENLFTWEVMQGDTTAVGGPTPPTVSAGSPQTITLPTASVTLAGSASANTPATSISTYLWTQTSGPNTGTFSSTTVPTPTFSSLIAGAYVLNLKVTDNNGNTNNANVTITVNAAPNFCRAFTWDSTKPNILITDAGVGASPRLHRCDTVYVPNSLDTAGYRSISVQSVGVQNDPNQGYIYIKPKHTTHIKIKPSTSAMQANVWGNNNWVEVDSLIVLNIRDPVIFNPYFGGYSHHMFFNGGNSTQPFFPSADITQALTNFAGDTVNCMFDWHWSHWRFDAGIGDTVVAGVPGGPFNGNTYIWLGALAKNGVVIGAEIDHSRFLNNSSDSAPATDIHMENCFYCLIDYDTLSNMGVVQHPTGHASVTFGKVSMIVEHNNLFKGNFGNALTSRGLGDIPSMYPFFRYWANLKGDTGYDGRSAFFNNRDSFSRKYPGVESENDPTDTLYNSFYRSRVGPRVVHNTFVRMQIGAGNKYYYNSAYDGYGGATDSVYFHNNVWVAAVTDSVISCPFSTSQGGCVMMSFPNGLSLHIDSGGNSQTYTMATAGLDSNTLIPSLNGILYHTTFAVAPTTTYDYLNNARPVVGTIDKGSTQYTTGGPIPPTVSAGSNQSITTLSTTLSGTATGNGGATIVSTLWTLVTKPVGSGNPAITTPNSLSTTVTALVVGTYVFQLSAMDSNANTSSSNVTVIVSSPSAPGSRLTFKRPVIIKL